MPNLTNYEKKCIIVYSHKPQGTRHAYCYQSINQSINQSIFIMPEGSTKHYIKPDMVFKPMFDWVSE